MKKTIIVLIVIVVLVSGVLWLRTQRMQFGALDAKFDTVKRGDLSIPIKASGKIQPKGRREIKSKASGEIIDMPYEEGQMVHEGDVLVSLKRDDEERNRDTAQAAYNDAEIALQLAKISWEEDAKQNIEAAEAARDRIKAQLDRVTVEYNQREELRKNNPDAISKEEWLTVKASKEELEAALRSAEVDVKKARIARDVAEKKYDQAKNALITAKRRLEDAEERLRETHVQSPIDGMIVNRYRNVGEMIQSGTESLTGGTILMEIADVSEVYMVASVDEADIGKVREMAPPAARPGADPRAATQPSAQALVEQHTIKENTRVTVSVEAFPDEKFEGVIERISPETEVAQAIATFEVRIRIVSPNKEKVRNLIGMQAEAEFTSVPMRNVLLVPYEAVRRGPSDELGVYIPTKNAQGDEQPEFKPCDFGPDNGIDVVVLDGLEEGQRVYTKLPKKTEAERRAEED